MSTRPLRSHQYTSTNSHLSTTHIDIIINEGERISQTYHQTLIFMQNLLSFHPLILTLTGEKKPFPSCTATLTVVLVVVAMQTVSGCFVNSTMQTFTYQSQEQNSEALNSLC